MEQQTQGKERQQRPAEQDRTQTAVRQPERERLSSPGQLALAALEGVSLFEMPPARLETLAALLGNQGMQSLLEQQALPLEEARFTVPGALQTTPFPVPGDASPAVTAPPSLPAGNSGGRAFDPAGLVY